MKRICQEPNSIEFYFIHKHIMCVVKHLVERVIDKIIHLFCCLAFVVIKSRLLLHIFTKTTNEIAIPDSSRKIIRQPDQPRELPHPSTKSRAPERGIRRDVRCGEGTSSLPLDHCAVSEKVGWHRGRSTGNTTVALGQH